MSSASAPTIARLVGVYNANGTLTGELAYFVGKRLGMAHCSLCDITHGLVSERADWQQCRAGLPVKFHTYHLNDQPASVRAATGGIAPIVVAETSSGDIVKLLDGAALDACAASPKALVDALTAAVAKAGLSWPQAARDSSSKL